MTIGCSWSDPYPDRVGVGYGFGEEDWGGTTVSRCQDTGYDLDADSWEARTWLEWDLGRHKPQPIQEVRIVNLPAALATSVVVHEAVEQSVPASRQDPEPGMVGPPAPECPCCAAHRVTSQSAGQPASPVTADGPAEVLVGHGHESMADGLLGFAVWLVDGTWTGIIKFLLMCVGLAVILHFAWRYRHHVPGLRPKKAVPPRLGG